MFFPIFGRKFPIESHKYKINKKLSLVNAYAPATALSVILSPFRNALNLLNLDERTDELTDGRSDRYMPPASVDAGGIKITFITYAANI